MIRRILVPLDSSVYSNKSTEFACRIAKIYDADVIGLVIIDIPGIERSIGPFPMGGSYYAKQLTEAKIKKADEKVRNILEEFKSICDGHGVKHREHQRQGIPSNSILEEAKFFDLLIIGRKTHFEFSEELEEGGSFDDILERSITPVIAVPEDFDFPKFPRERFNCLICFDGSYASCRALQRFAQLPISKFTDVKLLMEHDEKEYADFHLYEAKAFLRSHLFESVEKIHSRKNIISVVSDEYMDWADLFVLGAHSKGIFDFMIGSLTSFLIRESNKPIFIGL